MLDRKIAIVTGGSGAIGSAICRAFAAHGADVAFTYHRQEEAAADLAAAVEAAGRRCISESVGATDGAAVDAFVERVAEEMGEPDILVNNLGAAQVMPFALIDEDDWDQMMSVNLKSMFLFSKATARRMLRRKSGAIVNVGSLAGHRMLEVPVHYATAKAGVTGFTISLAKELSRYGVRVNEVTPGLIDGGVGANTTEEQRAEYAKFCALGRTGRPEEVAELVAFLASDRASYVNAQSLVIDGGI